MISKLHSNTGEAPSNEFISHSVNISGCVSQRGIIDCTTMSIKYIIKLSFDFLQVLNRMY